MRKKLFCLLLMIPLLCAIAFPESAYTRASLRDAYREITSVRAKESPYALLPDPASRCFAGALTEDARLSALDEVNFIRSIAGLAPVCLDPLCELRAQNAAYLLSVNDALTHDPPLPEGMPAELYESAHMGAQSSNIAVLNRTGIGALIDGIVYFVRDDGDLNLETLSHRRWLLNPEMGCTGFGLSESLSGAGYTSMYAVDHSVCADWDAVLWPASGVFPVEFMRADLPWSVSLNAENYDLDASHITVSMHEIHSGASFSFDLSDETGDGFCRISTERCGSGPCLIFRPNIAERGLTEYVQNQRWQVTISGLVRGNGAETVIEYECDMVSLYPQDPVNVEVSPLKLRLKTGEAAQLAAVVIPEYADDCSITWISENPEIADVDAGGVVTAHSAGICRVRAYSVNGRFDECEITVF